MTMTPEERAEARREREAEQERRDHEALKHAAENPVPPEERERLRTTLTTINEMLRSKS